MTNEQSGKYSKKHPAGTQVDVSLKETILQRARDNKISCTESETIARSGAARMEEIGVALDMLNIGITKCQLGLFGFSDRQKRVNAAESVGSQLESAIREAMTGQWLSCKDAWDLAYRLTLPRMDISAACEYLKIKIKPCQLGAF
jgi:hypothetical protein